MRLTAITLIHIFIIGICSAQRTINYENKTYTVGVCSNSDEILVHSNDLVHVTIRYSFITKINEDGIPFIHETYGSDYTNNICLPTIRSILREVIGAYTIQEIIGSKRVAIEDEMVEISRSKLEASKIMLQDILVTNIELPPPLIKAIEEKMIAQEERLAQKHRIELEKMKAEQRRIEAESTANYNHIIDSSLTEKILQLKYIEALTKLTQSQNVKIIVLGSDKLELPDILNENKQ